MRRNGVQTRVIRRRRIGRRRKKFKRRE